jgi:hypothetical protein
MVSFSDAMFHKRARRTRTQEPGADRMRDHFEELFLSNELSAEEIRDMFEDGAALNMHGMKDFAKAGSHGKHRQNVARDMLRKSMKKNKNGWPPLYYITVPAYDTGTQTRKFVKLPLLLPHEIVYCFSRHNDNQTLLNEDGMAECTKKHMARCRVELATPNLIGVGLWGDGVPCNFDKSQSLEVLTLNFPGLCSDDGSSSSNLRIPITAINKKFVIKSETWETVFQVISWSFGVLATGQMPSVDHLGREMTGQRLKWAGQACPPGVLREIRGDWAFYESVFRFPQHNENAGICWKCNCTPSNFRQVGEDAPWRQNTLSHFDLIARQLGLGLLPSSLFGCPCLRSECFLPDWLHAVDHGISPHFLASLFKYLLPKFPGRNNDERCKALFLDIKEYYQAAGVTSRLDNLTMKMLGSKSTDPPVLRSKAAECRNLVPYGLLVARRILDPADPVENTMIKAAFHLNECYKNLSVVSFNALSLKTQSRLFCTLLCALEASFDDKSKWHVTPKMHLFQELAEEMASCPSLYWTYRDEDMGGTLMQQSRRRGGSNNIKATAQSLLYKFIALNKVPYLS